MRHLITFILTILLSFNLYSQNTLKFLGIPIDGPKEEMINKLNEKGFKYNEYTQTLQGEFNGVISDIAILTVKDKVWRINVGYGSGYDDTNAIKAFNRLFQQFQNNGKYVLVKGEELAEDANISMADNRIDAAFKPIDKTINGIVWFMIEEGMMGKYRYSIYIFYENLDNEANGEDL